MDLVTFLRERLDDDEMYARVSSAIMERPERWVKTHGVVDDEVWRVHIPGVHSRMIASSAFAAAHIARHDPARVLREVAGKRAIVDLHVRMIETATGRPSAFCDVCDAPSLWPCPTLRHLAAVYADHPDYDKEWTP